MIFNLKKSGIRFFLVEKFPLETRTKFTQDNEKLETVLLNKLIEKLGTTVALCENI